MEFEGIHNFRDMGGVVTKDGRVVKHGLLLRSGHLHDATVADIEKLQKLHIQIIFDYRDDVEEQKDRDQSIEGIENVRIPALHTKSAVNVDQMMTLIKEQKFEQVVEDFTKMYGILPINNPAYKQLVHYMRNFQVPILQHCTAGKDRTGVGALIMYAILGVADDVIIEEYLLTNEANRKNPPKWMQKVPAVYAENPAFQQLVGVQAAYLLETFQAIYKAYGTMENYLVSEFQLGIEEIERLRDFYLQ